jgi:RNA polymerase sigma-70 factor (ECF subfamily)
LDNTQSPQPQGTLPPTRRSWPAVAPAPPPETPAATEDPTVARARRGDRDAFASLVEQHQQRIFGFVMRQLRCDRTTAEDMTQEVFLRVWRGLPGFDGIAFQAWLHTIAINVCISDVRRRRAGKRDQRTLSLDAPVGGTDDLYLDPPSRERDPAARVHDREIGAAVQAAVAGLPDEFRDAVLLRDLQGLSYEEIGETLGVPLGTVRSRIHRGRLLLQDVLKEFRP